MSSAGLCQLNDPLSQRPKVDHSSASGDFRNPETRGAEREVRCPVLHANRCCVPTRIASAARPAVARLTKVRSVERSLKAASCRANWSRSWGPAPVPNARAASITSTPRPAQLPARDAPAAATSGKTMSPPELQTDRCATRDEKNRRRAELPETRPSHGSRVSLMSCTPSTAAHTGCRQGVGRPVRF